MVVFIWRPLFLKEFQECFGLTAICRSLPACHYYAAVLPLKCSRHSWKQQCDVEMPSAAIRLFMIVLKETCCALNWLYLLHLSSISSHLPRPTARKLSRSEHSAMFGQKRWDRWFLPAKSECSFWSCLPLVLMLFCLSQNLFHVDLFYWYLALSSCDRTTLIVILSGIPSHVILKSSWLGPWGNLWQTKGSLCLTVCMNLWPASINLHNTSITLLYNTGPYSWPSPVQGRTLNPSTGAASNFGPYERMWGWAIYNKNDLWGPQ